MPEPVSSSPLASVAPLEPVCAPAAAGQGEAAAPCSPPDVLAKGQFNAFFGLEPNQKTLPRDKAQAIAKAAGHSSVSAFQRAVGIKHPDGKFGEETFLAARAFVIQEADKPHSALRQDQLAKLAFRLLPPAHPAQAKLANNPAQQVLDAFRDFVATEHPTVSQDLEIDCADYAGYLWHQFRAKEGLDDGLPGDFETLTKDNKDMGIYGVKKKQPTVVNDRLYAALFEKAYAEPIVPDRAGTTTTGKTFKAGGRTLDYGQIRPGDILFYNYEGTGASHTMVVVANDTEKREVKVAYGNYSSVYGKDGERIGVNPLAIHYETFAYGSYGFLDDLMGVYQVKAP